VLVVVAIAVFLILIVTAFGSSSPSGAVRIGGPGNSLHLLPAGPPRPQVVALQANLQIRLPINQTRITAIGYHAAGERVLPLQPIGRQGNEGLFSRLFHRIFGDGGSGIVYYQLGGDSGPATGALDVGAAPGTDVFAPVDGTIVGITPYIVNGRRYGSKIEIQPTTSPAVVVALTHLRADPSLAVGAPVTASASRIGTVADFTAVEHQALGRYTQDGGNHVALEVNQAATLALNQ
jgi:hypothetical protein